MKSWGCDFEQWQNAKNLCSSITQISVPLNVINPVKKFFNCGLIHECNFLTSYNDILLDVKNYLYEWHHNWKFFSRDLWHFIKSTMFPKCTISNRPPPYRPYRGVYFLNFFRHFLSDGHQKFFGHDFGHLGVLADFLW